MLALYDQLDLDAMDWAGLKLGGWPQTIQHELGWADANLVLQLDSDEKLGLNIVDSGCAYFGWSATRGWVFDAQFY